MIINCQLSVGWYSRASAQCFGVLGFGGIKAPHSEVHSEVACPGTSSFPARITHCMDQNSFGDNTVQFLAFTVPGRFIEMFGACHLSLSWARWISSRPHVMFKILILSSSRLRLSSNWSSDQNRVCISVPRVLHTSLIILGLMIQLQT